MVAQVPSDSLTTARHVVRVDIVLDWMCESVQRSIEGMCRFCRQYKERCEKSRLRVVVGWILNCFDALLYNLSVTMHSPV